MKKNVWLLGAAVAALTSCTQSEVLDVPEGKKIQFESFVEKNSRVSDLTNANLANFWVFGYCTSNTDLNGDYIWSSGLTGINQPFNNTLVTRDLDTDECTYSGGKHWMNGYMYRFAAYSNGNQQLTGVTYNPEFDQLTIPTYTVYDSDDDGGTDLDLVAAIAGDKHASTGGTPVNFQFRHLLSKVTIYLTNASSNADVHFNDLVISDVVKTGQCICSYSTVTPYPRNVVWKNTDGTDFVALSGDDFNYGSIEVPFNSDNNTHAELTFYVIPQSNDKTLTLDIEEEIGGVPHGGEDNLSFNLSANTQISTTETIQKKWVPGYHYRYTLTKGTNFNKIQFKVQVDTWKTDRDGNGNTEGADDVPLESGQGS